MDQHSDKLAAAVGFALSEWTRTENRLAHLFHVLSDIPGYRKAHTLFDSIISFEVRLTLCDRLMGFEQLEPIEVQVWKKYRDRAVKLYKKRHELAHFSFVQFQEDDGSQKIRVSPFFSMGKFTRGDATFLDLPQIVERAGKFSELAEATHWFWSKALQRRGLLEGSPEPETKLIIRLTELASQTLEDTPPKRKSSPRKENGKSRNPQ